MYTYSQRYNNERVNESLRTCKVYLGFIRKVKIDFFPIRSITMDISQNISCFKREKLHSLSTSAKIGLSYDIKFMLANSVDKKLEIFTSFFILFFFIS